MCVEIAEGGCGLVFGKDYGFSLENIMLQGIGQGASSRSVKVQGDDACGYAYEPFVQGCFAHGVRNIGSRHHRICGGETSGSGSGSVCEGERNGGSITFDKENLVAGFPSGICGAIRYSCSGFFLYFRIFGYGGNA